MTMAVMIGSARMDENGKISGGKAGDQTGKETSKQEWYLHNKGWYVLRAKSAEAREKIAQDMEYICDNPMISYDQSQNMSLYNAAKPYKFDASKVKVPCECDCAKAVRVCVLYAGIECGDFYTANEAAVLKRTGKFTQYSADKYCKSSDYLMRGDILVTRSKGHTVVVLTNGAKVSGTSRSSKPASAAGYAQYTDVSKAGAYRAYTAVNMRSGASTKYDVVEVIKAGDIVHNYGYYSVTDGNIWLYVKSSKGKVGFVSAKYLVRV